MNLLLRNLITPSIEWNKVLVPAKFYHLNLNLGPYRLFTTSSSTNLKMSEFKENFAVVSGQQKGRIQLIIGPMFSGKTTELMRRLRRFQMANRNFLLIKYANDNRYDSECISTHDKEMMPAVAATKLYSLVHQTENKTVIGIDEGQFVSNFPDIVQFAEDMANQNKTVIIAALDGTFQREGFKSILNLIPLSENVIKLNAVCMKCFEDASYTKRKGSETELEVIGGADKYMAVCRQCFYSPKKSNGKNNCLNNEINRSSIGKKLII
ncbi:Thymidine kinase, cytosolic [Nymphon striatum]|nr:Thymidine kinase, cytosolic [Nymphon striatum]